MALTIAVGFVVDDAIVMLENIYRHIEDGLSPLEAALKGAGEIGFTIMSHQHLAGRGVHSAAADGRHHRPAVPRVRHHRDHDHRGLGVRRADPLADDVRAVPARREACAARPRLHGRSSAASTGCWPATRAASTSCCDTSAPTLVVFLVTVARRCVLYIVDSQGLLPAAGHRHHRRACPMRRRTSRSPRWCGVQHRLTDVVAQGSGRRQLRRRHRRQPADQQRLRDPRPEAARRAQRQRRSDHQPAAPAARAGARRARCSCRPRRTQRRRPHHRAPSTSTRCRTRTSTSSTTGRRSCWRQLQKLPQLRDVASDQQTSSTMLSAGHRPRPGGALRHPAGS